MSTWICNFQVERFYRDLKSSAMDFNAMRSCYFFREQELWEFKRLIVVI